MITDRYLGDSVYVGTTGDMITLNTGSHIASYATNTIHLEASVFEALLAYAEESAGVLSPRWAFLIHDHPEDDLSE